MLKNIKKELLLIIILLIYQVITSIAVNYLFFGIYGCMSYGLFDAMGAFTNPFILFLLFQFIFSYDTSSRSIINVSLLFIFIEFIVRKIRFFENFHKMIPIGFIIVLSVLMVAELCYYLFLYKRLNVFDDKNREHENKQYFIMIVFYLASSIFIPVKYIVAIPYMTYTGISASFFSSALSLIALIIILLLYSKYRFKIVIPTVLLALSIINFIGSFYIFELFYNEREWESLTFVISIYKNIEFICVAIIALYISYAQSKNSLPPIK